MFITLFAFTFIHIGSGAPYPQSSVVKEMSLEWETHKRAAQGSDNFQLTWSDDDHLYGAWGDGGGFGGSNSSGRVGLGVARIEGPANGYRGFNVWGGHAPENRATFDGKSWAMISVNGVLYMWLVPDKPDGKAYRNHYEYVELCSSRDHGATWVKSNWRFQQSENLSIPTFLNFAKDNAGMPERFGDYVYSYFVRPGSTTMEQEGPRSVGLIIHQPGAIFLCRIPSHKLPGLKSEYEFYRGHAPSGKPLWGSVQEKRPVFEDPNGVGWCMSACYHPGLNRVLLCTEHHKSKQGNLGIFDAPNPWGPWTTVAYYDSKTPFGSQRAGSQLPWKNNLFFAAFPTKWFDGTTFIMNFTGAGNGKDNDSFNTIRGVFELHQ